MTGTRIGWMLAIVAMWTTAAHADDAAWKTEHKWHASTTGKGPVVLLVHGLAASTDHWRKPHEAWSLKNIFFDPGEAPSGNGLTLSPKPSRVSFFDKLADDFKVFTWAQIPCMEGSDVPSNGCFQKDTFDAAYATAAQALRIVRAETTGPIALVGHSRGGLLIRRLLKEVGNPDGRIKWVITLHTPHAGTSIAGNPNKIDDAANKVLGIVEATKAPGLSDIAAKLRTAKDALVKLSGIEGGKELAPSGPNSIYAALTKGERKLDGIEYVTTGGTSPTIVKVYLAGKQRAALLDNPAVAELTEGGDLLVTDDSAHWGYSDHHFSRSLHHGQVLWDPSTIGLVRDVINGRFAGGAITVDGKCVAAGADGGGKVGLAACSGKPEQQWKVLDEGALANVKSGKCLSLSMGKKLNMVGDSPTMAKCSAAAMRVGEQTGKGFFLVPSPTVASQIGAANMLKAGTPCFVVDGSSLEAAICNKKTTEYYQWK